MGRPLAPCGSISAYRRHKRLDEPVDEPCAQAARDQKNSRVAAKREAVSEVVRLTIADAPPESPGIDELAEARINLSLVKATMQAGVPTGMAALSKQYADLVVLVKRLENQSKPEVSRLDQLSQRRSQRISASTN